MPTSVFINEQLALRIQQHTGKVALAEFTNLIRHYRSNLSVFRYDVIHLLDETAAFAFGVEELPALKRDFRTLVEGAELPLILRSAWVCSSPMAWNVLEAWLHERHSLDGLHTDACLVGTLDKAAAVFEPDELAAVRNMTGFEPHFST